MPPSKYDMIILLLILFSFIMRDVIDHFYGSQVGLIFFVSSLALIILLKLVIWYNNSISWYKIASVIIFALLFFIFLAARAL